MLPRKFLYKSAQYIATLLDDQFRFGKFKIGLDPIIGLIPGGGDLISLGLSFYIVWVAKQLDVPTTQISLMVGNIFTDFLVGLIPILGDFADVAYKTNRKNMQILKKYAVVDIIEAQTA